MQMTANLDLTDIKEELKFYQIITKSKCKKLIKETSDKIVHDAQMNLVANGNFQTGQLSNSINYKLTDGGFRSVITVKAKHGIFIENGTKPHIIRAKNCKYLRFKQGGEIRYAKAVKHPGTKANPFLQPAINSNAPQFLKKLEDLGVGNY